MLRILYALFFTLACSPLGALAQESITQDRTELKTSQVQGPLIDEISLDTSYGTNSGRIYPLSVKITNSLDARTFRGDCTLDARRMVPVKKEFNLNQHTVVTFPLSIEQMHHLLNKPAGIMLVCNGHLYHDTLVTLEPLTILNSLFTAKDLPIETAALKPIIDNYLENKKWYEYFSSDSLAGSKKVLTEAVKYALNEDWKSFIDVMKNGFVFLQKASKEFKSDTLYLIACYNTCSSVTDMIFDDTFSPDLSFLSHSTDKKDYPITLSTCAAFLAEIEKNSPDEFATLKDALQENRLFITGGMWSPADLNLPSGEALLRQFLYGQRYFKDKLHITCPAVVSPSRCFHTKTLPQILKQMNFNYIIIKELTKNNLTRVPPLFIWKSPHGSEITAARVMHPGSDCKPETIAAELLSGREKGYHRHALLYDPVRYSAKNTTPSGCLEKIKNLVAFPAVIESDFDRFISGLPAKHLQNPFYEDSLSCRSPDYTTHGELKAWNRKNEVALENAEKFAVLSGIEYPERELKEAWKNLLLMQSHDIVTLPLRKSLCVTLLENQKNIGKTANTIIEKSLVTLGNNINISNPQKGPAVIVLNPSSWERSDLVELTLRENEWIKNIKSKDQVHLPVQKKDNRILFYAKKIPPLGYKTFRLKSQNVVPVQNELEISETHLENKFFKIQLNPSTGNIHSFFDKNAQRQLLQKGQEANRLQRIQNIGNKKSDKHYAYHDQPVVFDSVKRLEILERGHLRATLRMVRLYGNSELTQDYVIYADIPRLDIHTIADWHEKNCTLVAAFPLSIDADSLTCGIAYGQRKIPLPADTVYQRDPFVIFAQHYVDLANPVFGIAFFTPAKHEYRYVNKTLYLTLLRSVAMPSGIYSHDESPRLYSDQGSHEFTYSLFPHSFTTDEAEVDKKSIEFNTPLISARVSPQSGGLDTVHSFFSVDSDHVIISAIKKAEEGDDLILRLYETRGKATQSRLSMSIPVIRGWKCNMLEEKIESLTISNQSTWIAIEPYEILTLRFEKKSG
jgi:alpha-mannosidase